MAKDLPRSAATALVALVQKISLREEVDEAELTQLIEAVCQTPQERSTLLMALRQANDPDLRVVLSDRLRAFATKRSAEAEQAAGRDTAVGPWIQAFGGSSVLFALGAIMTGGLAGQLAALLVLLPAGILVAATLVRLRYADKRATAKHSAEQAEGLLKSIGDIRPDPADAPKPTRK